MCGIFGWSSVEAVAWDAAMDIALAGIKRLEYRGYDSAGVGVVFKDGSAMVIKSCGSVVELEKACIEHKHARTKEYVHTIIAHTRWATHGKPSTSNAHPHVSDDKNTFMVVHNGIVTNALELRTQLAHDGYFLKTQTDSEVIPKLFMRAWDSLGEQTRTKESLLRIASEVVASLEGSYAFLVTSGLFPGVAIGCRAGESPLLFGKGARGCVVSSDAMSMVEHTRDIFALGDREVLLVSGGRWSVYEACTLEPVHPVERVKMGAAMHDIDLGAFESYLEKEIFSQPNSIAGTVAHAEVKVPAELWCAKHIFLVGCGTSLHACMASKDALRRALPNTLVAVECASSFVDDNFLVDVDDACIFVSQSGETADTLAALALAREKGAFCLAVTNCPGSAIVRAANAAIFLHAGNEVSVASTKAYTSQVMLLHMLAAKIEGRDLIGVAGMSDAVSKTLEATNQQILRLLPWVATFDHILLVGRSSDFATCVEGALKIKEVPYVHAEAIQAGELKHGPLALIDDRVLVVVIATGHPKMKTVIEQLEARGALLVVMACEDENEYASDVLVPRSPVPELQVLLNVIPLQLLALHLAKTKKNNLDRPRNLAKSVTVGD